MVQSQGARHLLVRNLYDFCGEVFWPWIGVSTPNGSPAGRLAGRLSVLEAPGFIAGLDNVAGMGKLKTLGLSILRGMLPPPCLAPIAVPVLPALSILIISEWKLNIVALPLSL